MTGRLTSGLTSGLTGRGRAAARRLTLAAALLAACGGGEKDGGGGRGGEGGGGKRPVAVQVEVAAPRRVAETRSVTGTLAAAREARLLAQLEGAVTRVLVDEGDRVRAGALLATFDNSVQAAELDGARTRARVARAAADRAARLLALGAGSRAEQEEAAATLREAVGALRGAEARAGYGAVRAPFAGLVTAVRVNAGDVVGARQEVAVVADPTELRVEVPVSELDVVRLSPGDAVPVTIDALPGREFAGRVTRIYPTVDAATRQGVVEVSLRRAVPELRPGLLARLTLTVEAADGVLAVPLDAVRRDVRDQPYVYVVQDVFVREPAGASDGDAAGGSKGERKGEAKGGAKGDAGRGEKGASGEEQKGAKGRGDGGKRAEGDTVVRRAQIVLRRPVRVGLRGGDNYVQVVAGVRRGDRVVVTGDQELSDSARVRVLPTRGRAGDDGSTEVAGGARGGGAGGMASGAGGGSGATATNGGAADGSAATGASPGAATTATGGSPAAAVSGGAATGAGLAGTSAAGANAAAASGARSSAAAGAAAGAAGTTAPGAGRTPGAVGGVGGATGGGLSGGASASTGIPSRAGRAGAAGARAGARAGGTGRGTGTTGTGTGSGTGTAGGGPGGR